MRKGNDMARARRGWVAALLFFCASAAARTWAQPCTTPLVAVGPVSPVHGFPEYYLDANRLALQPCLDLVCDPALAVPNPAAPVSFPDNFPVETFYHRAISKLTGPGGRRACSCSPSRAPS